MRNYDKILKGYQEIQKLVLSIRSYFQQIAFNKISVNYVDSNKWSDSGRTPAKKRKNAKPDFPSDILDQSCGIIMHTIKNEVCENQRGSTVRYG